jgi:muramidase (phage lysozyme)
MDDLLIAAIIVGSLVLLIQRSQPQQQGAQIAPFLAPFYDTGPDPSASNGPAPEISQEPSLLDSAIIAVTPSNYLPANVDGGTAARNLTAFLGMIRYSEGTSGPDGYNTLFGYGRFDSFADHPRVYVPFGNTSSSAAGAYQILAGTWDSVRAKLGLPDFSPASQDAAAVELIRQRGALADVQAGRVQTAIYKVRKVWASLPGAGYGQGERSIESLLTAYNSNGGIVAA